jgi:DNA-binding GntR family transcriptional regulator
MTINIDLNSNVLRKSLYDHRDIPEVVMMIPAYYRLYMLLRGELQEGATDTLPNTQKGLSDQYGVCRATASAALALLRRDGLVNQGRRGRPSLQA